MDREPRLNRLQYQFLRELRNDADGLPLHVWPRPATLRRWLRKPRFRRALLAIRKTLRFQRDLHLAASASRAARHLQAMVYEQDPTSGRIDPDARLAAWVKLVRAEHLRENATRKRISQPKGTWRVRDVTAFDGVWSLPSGQVAMRGVVEHTVVCTDHGELPMTLAVAPGYVRDAVGFLGQLPAPVAAGDGEEE